MNKASDDDDDVSYETKQKKKSSVLDFWRSVSVTAPNANDHTKEGSFWGKDLKSMPRLWLHCLLAHKFLCIQGSSAPIERYFSKARQALKESRNRLDPEVVHDLVFCAEHLDLVRGTEGYMQVLGMRMTLMSFVVVILEKVAAEVIVVVTVEWWK